MDGRIIVLVGPSGAGKGRVFDEIAKRRSNVHKILSVTSRPKREDDKDNYVFVSEQEFISMINEDKFLEYIQFDGNYYGTTNIPVDELNENDLFFDKDVKGAIFIKEKFPEAITIFLIPKDEETLIKCRGKRGKNRHEIAKREIQKAHLMDFIVINDDINTTVDTVESIIEHIRLYSTNSKSNRQFLNNFFSK